MTKRALGAGTVIVDDEKYATSTFDYQGERFTIRELSTDEGDDIAEAATGPGPDFKFNARLNTRLLLVKALIDPEISVDRLGKFPGPKYLTILRAFNTLNSLPEANPTAPAGSAEPASPATGEQPQQP